jgi:hypothetical protein
MRRAAIGLAVVVAVCALIGVVRAGVSRRSRHPVPGAMAAPTATTLLQEVASPVTDGPDEHGAAASALSLLKTGETLIGLEPDAAASAVRATAAPEATERLAAGTARGLARMHAGFGSGPVSQRIAPLAVRAQLSGGGRAVVAVWYVAVVFAPGLPPYAAWRTMTYQLVWAPERWEEVDEADRDGPQPAVPENASPRGGVDLAAMESWSRVEAPGG